MAELADLRLVAVDAGVWLGLSAAVGAVAARLPDGALAESALTRIRGFEHDGRRWEALGVRRWKSAVPEAGALFGGVSKRRLAGSAATDRLLLETRRAELVHWVLLGAAPLFALWNPAWLTAAMVAFAVVANVPCILVQRFNRARLLRLQRRRDRIGAAPAGIGAR